MTALAERHTPNGWADMPGWGVVADLTPPELNAARSLHTLRRALAISLLAVVLLCAGGYVLASMSYSTAQDRLSDTNSRTAQLTAVQSKYAAVTQLRNAAAGINGQLATLFKNDVDTAGLFNRIAAALPAGMSLTSVNMSFNSAQPGVAGSAPTTGSTPAAGATTNGAGTLTLAGTSPRLVDLADFVASLNNMRGITNVVPTNNSIGGATGGASWTLTLQLTDAAYSHHYTASGNTAPAGGPR